MENKEKLMLVFDFLAEYLSNESNTNSDTTNTNSHTTKNEDSTMAKAYDIMKKVDEMDKTDARIKSAVNNATKPLKEAINKVKTLYKEESELNKKAEEVKDLTEKFTERTGITLDDEGKLVEVKVGPLKEYTTISQVMEEINK